MCETPTEYDLNTQDLVPRTWYLPPNVPRDLQIAAKAALPGALDDARVADQDTIRKWLAALGVLCAGQLTAADAKAKISIYAPMLREHSAAAFTAATLQRAGKKFKWFPSFAEIDEFLRPFTTEAANLAVRLDEISQASERNASQRTSSPANDRPPMGKTWREMNADERAEWERWRDSGFGLQKMPA